MAPTTDNKGKGELQFRSTAYDAVGSKKRPKDQTRDWVGDGIRLGFDGVMLRQHHQEGMLEEKSGRLGDIEEGVSALEDSPGAIWRLSKSSSTIANVTAAAKPQDAKAKAAKKAALKGTSGQTARKFRTSVSFHRPTTLKLARKPKYLRKSVPHLPRMDQFRTIQYPLNTESAMKKI